MLYPSTCAPGAEINWESSNGSDVSRHVRIGRMDDRTFAYHLSAWLDPYELLTAAERYDRDRDRALAPEGLIISSGLLTRGTEANFAAMAKKYLRGFHVPSPLIDLVRVWAGSSGASLEAWSWLRNLSLSPKVHCYSHGTTPLGIPPTTVLQIEERDVVTDIVKRPVMALLDLAGMLAINWREWATMNASIYHKHNMSDPFYAYVDLQVASAYLSLVDPTSFASGAPKFRYRAVTLAGIPDDDRLWELAQEAARGMAASTHEPIRERGQ
jgi:hypothetical protein